MFKASGVAIGIVAIVIGALVLALPELLRWIVGIGLIVVGPLAVARR
jgi:cytochrome c biogenesis protein CcdA